MRLPIVALLTIFAVGVVHAQSSTPQSATPQASQSFDPALREPWSRGPQRFQRQWLFAGPVASDAVSRIAGALALPAPGKPVSSDVPDVRWMPHTSWSDTIDLDGVVRVHSRFARTCDLDGDR
jgi:hypothetical protein